VEFVLHLGVHRTGTTALQQAGRQNAAVLAEHGVEFWGPKVMRDPHLRDFVNHTLHAENDPELAADVAKTRKTTQEAIRKCQSRGVKRLIISEENLIGSMDLNFRYKTLYPKTLERLSIYRDLFPSQPDQIFISIRDYASYWASSYAFASLRKPLKPFDEIHKCITANIRGWPEVLAEISAAFPQSHLIVQPYQNDKNSLLNALKKMLGTTTANAMILRETHPNAALPAAALTVAQKLRADKPEMLIADLLSTARSQASGKTKPFQPFSGKEKSHLTTRYKHDLDLLKNGAIPSLELYDPTAGASA
jgi:hypothetical protein